MEITYMQSLFNVAPNIISLQWWPILVTKYSTNNTHDVVTWVLQFFFGGGGAWRTPFHAILPYIKSSRNRKS